jgi:uncharacterized BrkB/YihY/UPF0761 family membrane protein
VRLKHGFSTWLRWLRDRVPGLRVIVLAVQNYIGHQSANQAGSVAFSSVLAMFPLLIFLAAILSYTLRSAGRLPSSMAGSPDSWRLSSSSI